MVTGRFAAQNRSPKVRLMEKSLHLSQNTLREECRLPGTPRVDPDVQFSRIRFLGCTRFRGAKHRLQAYTLRRLTSVIRGRAIFTWSRACVNCSQVKLLRWPPRRLSHLNVQSMTQLKRRCSERESPRTP
jgi:hypothetical protein